MKRIILFSSLFIGQLLLTACGNVFPANSIYAPSSVKGLNTTTDAYAKATNSRFNCKGLATITPQLLVYSNSSDFYEVCKSSTDTLTLAIHGTTQNTNGVCFFPAYQSGQTWKAIPSGSTYSYICGTPSSNGDGVVIQPTITGFSAAIIVEAGRQNDMVNCILNGYSGSVCPPWSAGNF